MEEEMQVMVDVARELENNAETSMQNALWAKRSIYKLPASVPTHDVVAYRPQIVSFGPYHYCDSQLKPLEEHKHRALHYFLKRSGKPLQLFLQSLNDVVQDLMDSYDQLDESWKNDTTKFLQLMILDGCFMLEILSFGIHPLSSYAADDPIFSSHGRIYMAPFIKRDMLIAENQLPMLVLYKLVAIESDGAKDEEYVHKLILGCCYCSPPQGKCLHVLDLYRKNLLQTEPNKKKIRRHGVWGGFYNDASDIIPSATKLHEAGIQFRKSKTNSLRDISFEHGVLELPVMVVDDVTEALFLNLMAFERFHVGAGNEVTSYVFLMDCIIDNGMDVALLSSRGLIQNAIGSEKAVAELFNSMSKNITLDQESSLDSLHKEVNAYCRQPWNAWRANLIQTYFRNPWAALSLAAALFLFALTIVQTVYTILDYYKKS